MLMRQPAALFPTYGSLNTLPTKFCGSSTSSNRGTRQRPCPLQGEKSYATVVGDSSGKEENAECDTHAWPRPPKGQPHPTPYQILAMQTNATYSKTRYYELVKIYHPDRTTTPSRDLASSVRLERYRLIVAAHAILSDPTKRSAYDRFGAGWNGKADIATHHTRGQSYPAGPFSRSWNDPSDPIWRNATWEDWERWRDWRARQEGAGARGYRQPQAPVYFQNSYFIMLVAILALIGSTANSFRAHDAGTYFIHQRDMVHDRTAKELRRVKQDATSSGSKQDRIDWFLRNREATLGLPGSDAEALRQEKVDRLLPGRETCNSEETAGKNG